MPTESDIQAFGNRTITDLLQNYLRLGLKASGEYGTSLKNENTIAAGRINIKILGAKQALWMEEGRRPNTDKSTEAVKKLYPVILQWVIDKGISVQNIKSFAYLSARKIVREGWKVPNQHNAGGVVSDIINEQWYREGINVAGGALLSELSSEILTNFKRMKNGNSSS